MRKAYSTYPEFAERYGVAVQTVQGWISRQRFGLTSVRVGGRALISAEAEAAFLLASAEASQTDARRRKRAVPEKAAA